MTYRELFGAVMSILLASACVSADRDKPAAKDDFSSLAGVARSSQAFTTVMGIEGNLNYGDWGRYVSYSDPPHYRAFTFSGMVGEKVDIQIRSTNGDPITWLLDSGFLPVAKNDDADGTTLNSHITHTLPRTGQFFIAFRDFESQPADFTVSLQRLVEPSGGSDGCIIGGASYPAGAPNPFSICQTCQPLTSKTTWTDRPNGTVCVSGAICTGGVCSASCLIGGIAYPQSATNPTNKCESCQPASSTSTWTDLPNGTNCGFESLCSARVCSVRCSIAGFLYYAGQVNPTNPCQSCQPNVHLDAWSSVPDGTTCGSNRVCTAASCGVNTPTTVCAAADEWSDATVVCPAGKMIGRIDFASYGAPIGSCGGFGLGSCNATNSSSLVAGACLGKASCTITASNDVFGDPCYGTSKRLDMQVSCW